MTNAPLVSVIMLTYNHESFIRQAIESVLMQQVGFAYELIIGEDCSTDQTRRIVQEYAHRYPDRIVPLYQARNIGMGPNLRACFAAAKGRYLAPLEGDDYWTDPLKLQKQVDFLTTHPNVALCFHEVQIVQGTPPVVLRTTSNRDTYTMRELLASDRTIPMTCSLLLRRDLVVLPDWLLTVGLLDYPLVIMQTGHGKLGRLPEVMAAYRRHSGGVWSGASPVLNQRRFIHMYEHLVTHYAGTPHAGMVRQALYRHCLTLADALSSQGLTREAAHFLRRAVRARPGLRLSDLKSLLGVTSRWSRSFLSDRKPHAHDTPFDS